LYRGLVYGDYVLYETELRLHS